MNSGRAGLQDTAAVYNPIAQETYRGGRHVIGGLRARPIGVLNRLCAWVTARFARFSDEDTGYEEE